MKTFLVALLLALMASPAAAAESKKIILLAGRPSHPAGQHEHRAGMLLLQQCLAGFPGITVEVHNIQPTGLVEDERIFDGAAAVVVYTDGAGGHPYLREGNLAKIGALAARGVGLGMMHYGVEPTLANGHNEFLDWTGGSFEVNHSVNPVFRAEFTRFPQHAVTRGVRPFTTHDEWYYNIRFREGMRGVTPILTMVPPASSLNRPDAPRLGAREGNESVWAAVRNREPQHVMWVTERADGGRGFGFTGGHYHANWANDEQRKLVLNAIVWLAKVEVPANGVASSVTPRMMRANLDPKGGRGANAPSPVVSSIGAMVTSQALELSDARRALLVASLAWPADPQRVAARLRDVATADAALATATAAVFHEIQSSPDRLDADAKAVAVQAAIR